MHEQLQTVYDAAQQMIALCADLNDDVGVKSAARTTAKTASSSARSSVEDWLVTISADFAREADGDFEVAERGHAIISVERALRRRDESIFASIDGGLVTVFDRLTGWLRVKACV